MPEAYANSTLVMFDDTYLNMGLVIPIDGDRPDIAKVTKCLRNKDGRKIGRFHNDTILDTIM